MNEDSRNQPLNLSGIGFSLACAACVGSHIVVSKLAIENLSTFVALSYLALFALAFSVIPYSFRRPTPVVSGPRPLSAYRNVFFHSLLASCGMISAWSGLALLNPTITSFVGRLEVVVSVACSILFLNEKMSKRKFFGFLFGLLGVLTLSTAKSTHVTNVFTSVKDAPGIFLVIISAFCYGSCEVFSVKAIKYFSLQEFVFLRSLFNCLFIVTFASLRESSFAIQWPDLVLIAIASFLGPYFGRHLFMASVRRIPLSISIGLNQSQPLFAAIFGLFFVMDLPSPREWFGGILILCGCLILILPGWKYYKFKQII